MRKLIALTAAGLISLSCASTAGATETDTPGVVEAGDDIYVTNTHVFGPATPFIPVKIGAHCSLGPVLTPTTAVTAGHCGKDGDTVSVEGKAIGTLTQHVDGMDLAVITLKDDVKPRLSTLGDMPAEGSEVWKRGERTGVTRGTIESGLTDVVAEGPGVLGSIGLPDPLGLDKHTASKHPSKVYLSTMCADQGDSGAAVYSGDKVVGIVSAVSGDCDDPNTLTAIVPVR